MRRAVKAWEPSKYWTMRAKGAIHAAKYKELPRVRANRIKGLEADKRKQERNKANAEKFLNLWGSPDKELTLERAKAIANHDWISHCFTLDKYPREEPISQYEGMKSLWSALEDGIITAWKAAEIAIPSHIKSIAYADRWINHISNRLLYEKAMLEEQGESDRLKPAHRAEQLPLCNYRVPEGFIMIENLYHRGEMMKYRQIDMTKAGYSKLYADYKATRIIENSHRVRIALIQEPGKEYYHREHTCVFIADSKEHKKPEPIVKDIVAPLPKIRPVCMPPVKTEQEKTFEALKETLKTGVKTVFAPQLFPTPPEIAQKMVELADLKAGQSVLEPSAGTGNIIMAIRQSMGNGKSGRCAITAVEINRHMCDRLINVDALGEDFVHCGDFLKQNGALGTFDRIVMNPPFENGVDIKHIRHALKKLNPGGRLVALCANWPRQREAFMDMAEYWENLPAGSFKEQGTGVNVALVVITKED